MTAHAILSASSSYRWLHCPPSARLNARPDEASPYALEGSAAHELAEYKLKSALGMKADDPTENLSYYSKEMEDAAAFYADHIMESLEGIKHHRRSDCPDRAKARLLRHRTGGLRHSGLHHHR